MNIPQTTQSSMLAPQIMNEELVCNSQHMLATAVFYYTLSNMRNLGLQFGRLANYTFSYNC